MFVFSREAHRPELVRRYTPRGLKLRHRNEVAVARRVAEPEVRVDSIVGDFRDEATYRAPDAVRTEDDICCGVRSIGEFDVDLTSRMNDFSAPFVEVN